MLGKTVVRAASAAYDHVVDKRDVDQASYLYHFGGQCPVLAARVHVAGRVVVHQHESGSIRQHERFADLL